MTPLDATDRPVYDRPPVVETSLGVQFKPLRYFKSLHYGLFWNNILSDMGWAPVTDEGLLPRLAESFDNVEMQKNSLGDPGEPVVGVRLKLENERKDRVLYVQPDKLFMSWVLRADEEPSPRPHYADLKSEFAGVFAGLVEFAEAAELGPIEPDLWEVKYLNQVAPGPLWSEPSDWHGVLPALFPPAPAADGLRLATYDGEWFYEIEPKRGRVRVRAAKMLVNHQPPAVLYIRLIARGEISEAVTPDWPTGFDIGHAACNRLFNRITSPEAQQMWGKQS